MVCYNLRHLLLAGLKVLARSMAGTTAMGNTSIATHRMPDDCLHLTLGCGQDCWASSGPLPRTAKLKPAHRSLRSFVTTRRKDDHAEDTCATSAHANTMLVKWQCGLGTCIPEATSVQTLAHAHQSCETQLGFKHLWGILHTKDQSKMKWQTQKSEDVGATLQRYITCFPATAWPISRMR